VHRAVFTIAFAFGAACDRGPAQTDAVDTNAGDPSAIAPPPTDALVAPGLRLPDDAEPTGYVVRLEIDPDAKTFTGRAEVSIDLKTALDKVWIHAVDLEITQIDVDAGGTRRAGKVVGEGDQMIAVDLGGTTGPGPATLTFAYGGTTNTGDGVEGVFKQRYQGRWYVFTQFEAVQARRAMPCFDEPRFKVPWQMTLVVPQHQNAFGNAPVVRDERRDGKRVIELAPTPPLPSYLIAFAVGPFVTHDVGPVGRDGVPARIIALAGTPRATVATAIAWTPKIVTYLEDYFDRPYPYAKLDQIAVPRFFGAMENPGLITYARRLMYVDEKRRGGWVQLAGHEIAHQWFGNLVTPSWWGDIWLNESFATWMAAKIVGTLVPGKNRDINVGWSYEYAMDSDVKSSSPRLGDRPLATNEEAENAFDAIAYDKGGAVLTMFERWIGEDKMRAAVRDYIERDAGKITETSRFLDAIERATDAEARAVLASYVEQAGVPLVSVELACEGAPRVKMTQERIVDGAPTFATWKIPVCVRYATTDGASKEACGVVKDDAFELALPDAATCPAWIVANPGGHGYYRVRYLGEGRLGAAWKQLTSRERILTRGSLEALAETSLAGPDDVVGAIPMLLGSGAPADEIMAFEMVSATSRLVPHERRPAWRAWAAKILARPLAKTGGSPRLRSQRYWFQTLLLESPPVLARARAAAARWAAGAKIADANAVLRAAMRGGDRELGRAIAARAAELDAKNEDRGAALRALGAAVDPDVASDAFDVVLDKQFTADEVEPILSWLGARPSARAVLLDRVTTRTDELIARFAEADAADAILPPFDAACDREERDRLAAALQPIAARLKGGTDVLKRTLDTIEACITRRATHGPRMEQLIDASF
jgi:alanyl aminopeptidase